MCSTGSLRSLLLRAKRAPGRLDGCLCLDGNDCAHVRTRRDRQSPNVPYQTDYLFASEARVEAEFMRRPASEESLRFTISDHAPIVADFAAA